MAFMKASFHYHDKGVVGQVVAVAKLTSRVLLICDATHALPIRVLRNDIRVIAVE